MICVKPVIVNPTQLREICRDRRREIERQKYISKDDSEITRCFETLFQVSL
jgi:hypothetical protein